MSLKCRTCAAVIYNKDPRQLFDDPNDVLLNQIEQLTGYWLNEDPDMPRHICACCVADLSHGLSFLKRCIMTQMRLNQSWQSRLQQKFDSCEVINAKDATSKHLKELERLDPARNPADSQGYRLWDLDCLIDSTEWSSESICRSKSKTVVPCVKDDKRSEQDKLQIKTNNTKSRTTCSVGKPRFDWSTLSEDEAIARKRQMAIKHCVCERCGMSFNNSSNFKQHMVRHSGIKNFQCNERKCEKKYYSQHELNLHTRIVHKGFLPYACKYCDKEFRRSARRTEHQKTHLQPEFSCSYCGKTFYDRYKCKRHEFSHTGVRNFHCNNCDQSFLSASNLQVHYRSKTHQNTVSRSNRT